MEFVALKLLKVSSDQEISPGQEILDPAGLPNLGRLVKIGYVACVPDGEADEFSKGFLGGSRPLSLLRRFGPEYMPKRAYRLIKLRPVEMAYKSDMDLSEIPERDLEDMGEDLVEVDVFVGEDPDE